MMYKALHSCSSYIGQLIEIVESGMQRIISGLGSLMVSRTYHIDGFYHCPTVSSSVNQTTNNLAFSFFSACETT